MGHFVSRASIKDNKIWIFGLFIIGRKGMDMMVLGAEEGELSVSGIENG